jgi:hypothetical protein
VRNKHFSPYFPLFAEIKHINTYHRSAVLERQPHIDWRFFRYFWIKLVLRYIFLSTLDERENSILITIKKFLTNFTVFTLSGFWAVTLNAKNKHKHSVFVEFSMLEVRAIGEIFQRTNSLPTKILFFYAQTKHCSFFLIWSEIRQKLTNEL